MVDFNWCYWQIFFGFYVDPWVVVSGHYTDINYIGKNIACQYKIYYLHIYATKSQLLPVPPLLGLADLEC